MFKFLSKKKPQPEQSQSPLPLGIRDAILQVVGANNVPSMPAQAQKAFELSTDPNAEARDFIDVIQSDEALSARVLKIANSVYFDRGKKSETIEECVIVIGLNELRSLLNATTLSEIFPSKHPARSQLWANDIGTAIIAKHLAQRLMPEKQDLAFLAGLMHDIGKLLLLQRASEEYGRILKNVEDSGQEFSKAETQVFVFDHSEVGQLVAEKWNFSSELTAAIRRHHQNWQELSGNDSASALTRIIKAADCIAHALGLGHARGFQRLKNNYSNQLEQVWEALGIASNERKDALLACERAYNVEHELYSQKGQN